MSLAERTPVLAGAHVRLEHLSAAMAPALHEAASIERSTYDWTTVPADQEAMGHYIGRLLADAAADLVVPFAHRELATDRLVGCTRFLELRFWSGGDTPDEVEVGGTWLAGPAQRTAVNTEAKLLMLRHAFEVWGCWRVAIATDARNERSRQAIERLGAEFEGVLRRHRLSTHAGDARRCRDTAMYSIVDDDWPDVERRLTARLQRGSATEISSWQRSGAG